MNPRPTCPGFQRFEDCWSDRGPLHGSLVLVPLLPWLHGNHSSPNGNFRLFKRRYCTIMIHNVPWCTVGLAMFCGIVWLVWDIPLHRPGSSKVGTWSGHWITIEDVPYDTVWCDMGRDDFTSHQSPRENNVWMTFSCNQCFECNIPQLVRNHYCTHSNHQEYGYWLVHIPAKWIVLCYTGPVNI